MKKKKKVVAKTAKTRSTEKDFSEPLIHKVATKILADDEMFIPKYLSNSCSANIFANIKIHKVPSIKLPHRAIVSIDCGFSIDIRAGYKIVVTISDYLARKGLIIPNTPCYKMGGRVSVILTNIGREIVVISHGDSIANITIEPIYDFDFLVLEQ